jgi:ribosomal protein L37AE/L43A
MTAGSPPRCPFCGTDAVHQVARWGGQIITAQWQCDGCASYFEAVRADFDDPRPAPLTDPIARSVDGP